MDIRVILPEETVPSEVFKYLLPDEKGIVTVRTFPVLLSPLIFLVLADLTAFVLDAAGIIPGRVVMLVILGALFPASCYLLYRGVRVWLHYYIVAAPNRLILVKGGRKSRLTVVPISKVADMTFTRTLAGQMIGYGSFRIRGAGRGGRALTIRYLPYPEQLYLEVCAWFYRDLLLLFAALRGDQACLVGEDD
jgi:Bacterial PH domain